MGKEAAPFESELWMDNEPLFKRRRFLPLCHLTACHPESSAIEKAWKIANRIIAEDEGSLTVNQY
jgi:hypothetical protein